VKHAKAEVARKAKEAKLKAKVTLKQAVVPAAGKGKAIRKAARKVKSAERKVARAKASATKAKAKADAAMAHAKDVIKANKNASAVKAAFATLKRLTAEA